MWTIQCLGEKTAMFEASTHEHHKHKCAAFERFQKQLSYMCIYIYIDIHDSHTYVAVELTRHP